MCFLTFCRKETDSGRKKRMEGGREKKGKEGEIVRLTTIIPLKITEEEIDQKVDKLPKVTQ